MNKPIVFLGALWCSVALLNAQVVIDKVVAVVGKNVVLLSDVETQYQQMKAQGSATESTKCEVFEDLLYQKLLLDQAQKDSIEVTEKEIDDNLDRRIRYFVSQVGSEQKLEEFYGKSISEIKEEFREVIARQMLSERMQGKLTGDVKVTPTEIRRFYNTIPKDSLPKINKQLILQQLVRYPPIDEKEKLEIKEKLKAYRDRIIKGEKFSTLAVLYSEDPGSARKGGELGFVGRNDLVPEFAAVAFKLKEPDDVSRIVETEFGFHIIQMIEKRGEQMNLRHILLKPKIAPTDLLKAQKLTDSLRLAISIDSISFDQAVTRFSEDVETNKNNGLMMNPMTGNTFFEYDQLQPAMAYALKDVSEHGMSKPFKTQDERARDVYKIVYIKEIIEPHTANMTQDYQLIQDICQAHKQQDIMTAWVLKKQQSTYIKLEDDFKTCPFKYQGWIK
jgi:peptidyl-prolyl cis-trans isomerase SurA